MPTIRNTFHRGIMDKDTDERLLGEGVLRHAENVHISTSEGSDVGAVENILSNKKRTNLNFGLNAVAIGNYVDKAKNKIYWLVVSDSGSYLVEFNQTNGTATMVLEDTRVQSERVLDLHRNFPITGIAKIVSEQDDKDLLLFTDDHMDVCCINIERAKAYPSNGFAKEDIFLIKKPPLFAPQTELIYSNEISKNIEERFFCFAYRYKYLDGEYSALSPFSNYMFLPKHFNMDYDTLENVGMINLYNAIKIDFATGDKRVTDIQLIAKSSNSNNLYIIETFNKKEQGFDDNQTQSFIYKNDKLYSVLPEKELYRLFDNVPRKAKALTMIGNRPVLGNYLEGYDLLYNKDKKIKIDFRTFVNSQDINEEFDLYFSIGPGHVFGTSDLVQGPFKAGWTFIFSLVINYEIEGGGGSGVAFEQEFAYTLQQDYYHLYHLWGDLDFISFVQNMHTIFRDGYLVDNIPDGWGEDSKGSLWSDQGSNKISLALGWATYTDTYDGNKKKHVWFKWNNNTKIYVIKDKENTSLHSNRDYQVAMLYVDEFGRETTGLVCPTNTVYVKQENSVTKNTIGVKIYHRPPDWAKYYRFAVKSQPLTYQTIYISKFYVEDMFVWCLLEGDNKDKVKSGDELLLKRGSELPIGAIVKVKVLDVVAQEKDFIANNKDDNGNDIIEEAGLYMKIKPMGFSMSQKDYAFFKDSKQGENYGDTFNVPHLYWNNIFNPPLGLGSEIYIKITNVQHLKKSHMGNVFEQTYHANESYDSFYDWLMEKFIGKPIYGNGDGSDVNLGDKIKSISVNDSGKIFLHIEGIWAPKYTNHSSYVEVEIQIRATKSDAYVFETAPDKETDLKLFFHSTETFLIEAGNHKGNRKDQDLSGLPAEVELSFHNCYTFGNGVESYKIKDAFTSNYLNIDLKPTAVSVEEYRAIRRYADLTYSEPYVGSTNINGINEFNNSTANWKELDKQDGAVQILYPRENDLLVVQKNKWGKVLFGKDALYNTEGQTSLSKVPYVLGQYIPYAGDYGMTDPTSFAVRARQCYGVDKDRGVVLRLSDNGLTPIVYGMQDWFRDVFHKNKKSVVIGGIDPYHGLYQITIGDNAGSDSKIKCGGNLSMHGLSEEFVFYIELNDLSGLMTILFNITGGTATIIVEFDSQEYTYNNASGTQNIEIDRVNTEQNLVKVTIIPNGEISFDVSSDCPKGEQMKLVTMVLTDPGVDLTMLLNKFRWGDSAYFDVPNLPYDQNYGVRGQGKFPENNTQVQMTKTDLEGCGHRLLYAIGDFSQSDVLENAIEHNGTFTFLTSLPNATLYLIWDYTDKKVTPLFGSFPPICQGETPSLPTTSLNGITGSWTKLQSIKLDNSTDRYLFTPDDGQCAEEVEMEIAVMEKVTPLFMDIPKSICQGTSFSLDPISDNGIAGSWSPAINNTQTTTYTFTPSSWEKCAKEIEVTIAVMETVTPLFGSFPPVCKDIIKNFRSQLPTTSLNGIKGNWSLYGCKSDASQCIYIFTPDDGQCAETIQVTINGFENTPTFEDIPYMVCEKDLPLNLPTISDNGITGSWTYNELSDFTYEIIFTPDDEQCAEIFVAYISYKKLETPTFTIATRYCWEDLKNDINYLTQILPTMSDNGIHGSWSYAKIPKNEKCHFYLLVFTPHAGECAEPVEVKVEICDC